MDDYRVKVGFFDHPKVIRLERSLGPGAVVSLLRLWDFCAQYRTDGVLSGMDNEDVAAAGRWQDNADGLVDTLVRCKLLDRDDGGVLSVHDWAENNPYVASKSARVAQAKAAAAARWGSGDNAERAEEQCSEHAASMPPAQISNAHNPTQPNTFSTQPLLCCWGQPRTKKLADLNKAVEDEFSQSVPPKWVPLAGQVGPFSEAEITNAITEAKREPKPSAGLVVRILERYRNTKPVEARVGTGPPVGAAGPITKRGREMQAVLSTPINLYENEAG